MLAAIYYLPELLFTPVKINIPALSFPVTICNGLAFSKELFKQCLAEVKNWSRVGN